MVFGLTSGSITWMYMAEISTAKAMGLGTLVNWILILTVSFFTNDIMSLCKDITND